LRLLTQRKLILRQITATVTVLTLLRRLTRIVWIIAFSSPDSLVISSISLGNQN